MVAAYYDRTCDAKKTFEGFKITKHPSFEKFANKFTVIKITIPEYINSEKGIDYLIKQIE